MDENAFEKERLEALSSLNEEKIRAWGKKWGAPLPKDSIPLMAGVHKALVYLDGISDEQRLASMDWLEEHGYQTSIGLTGGSSL